MSAKRKPSPELPLPPAAAAEARGAEGAPASPAPASAARAPAASPPSPAPALGHHPAPSGRLKKKKSSGGRTPTPTTALGEAAEPQEPLPPPQPRARPKKEPLPMKLRALPLSFWQQPNVPAPLSAGAVCPALPPLAGRDAFADLSGPRAPSPPEGSGAGTSGGGSGRRHEYVSAADTDLLFALFRGVEQTEARPTLTRRGRPRKQPSTLLPGADDPCLVSVSADPLLPLLPSSSQNSQQQVLAMVSVRSDQRSSPVSLPSLSVEHNYSQLLADLVIRL